MRNPNFFDGQFVSATTETEAFSQVSTGVAEILDSIFTTGVFNLDSASFTVSNLSLTCDLGDVAVLFEGGTLARAYGTTNGSTTSVYTLDLSSYVPSSGTATVYIIATQTSIGLNSSVISGPPPGNPDYDPTFTPYSGYLVYLDSLAITASLTAPVSSSGQFEIARLTLSQGITTLPSPSTDSGILAGVPDVTDWTSKQIVNAESITTLLGSYATKVFAEGTFEQSGNSYIVKFPNGFIIQGGRTTTGSGGQALVEFMEPFPTAVLSQYALESNATVNWGNGTFAASVGTGRQSTDIMRIYTTVTQVNVSGSNPTLTYFGGLPVTVDWIAFGF